MRRAAKCSVASCPCSMGRCPMCGWGSRSGANRPLNVTVFPAYTCRKKGQQAPVSGRSQLAIPSMRSVQQAACKVRKGKTKGSKEEMEPAVRKRRQKERKTDRSKKQNKQEIPSPSSHLPHSKLDTFDILQTSTPSMRDKPPTVHPLPVLCPVLVMETNAAASRPPCSPLPPKLHIRLIHPHACTF